MPLFQHTHSPYYKPKTRLHENSNRIVLVFGALL
jgi:hypothetical protein